MAQRILGIDIGSYSVKITELSRFLRDFELVHYYEQVINPSTRLTYEESVAAALQTIVEKNDLAADVIAVSLPAHHLSCRVIELPFTNIKKIEQTIDYELEAHIPVPLDELLVDYHILSVEENRSTVLVAYIPKARFVKYLDLLQVAGVDPKYVGLDSIDLSNIAQVAMVPQEAVYAILDIGHQKTNICVMEGLQLRYVRSVTIAGIHFTRAIQKVFHLNLEKAEGLKLDRGRVSLKEEELDQISRPCQGVAEELVVAIKQTYLGYRQIYPNRQWSALYLTGGGSRMPGLGDMISSALRMHVGTLDCLDFTNHRLEQPEVCRDLIASSLSQTLRVIFSNKAVKINFRRGEFAFQRDFKALSGEIKQLGIWFGVILFLGIFYFLFSYYTLSSRIDKVDRGLVQAAIKVLPELKGQERKGAKQLLNIIASKTTEIKPQLDAIQSGASEVGPLTVLMEISKRLPPKGELQVDVDDFTFTGDRVRIEGRTVSHKAVSDINNALAESPYFKNVTILNEGKGIRDEVKFSLSIDVVTEEES